MSLTIAPPKNYFEHFLLSNLDKTVGLPEEIDLQNEEGDSQGKMFNFVYSQEDEFNDGTEIESVETEDEMSLLNSNAVMYADEDLENISVNNMVRLYFKQVASEPLLSQEEEVELAKCIETGEKARTRLAKKQFVPEDYLQLRQQIEDESQARERLIKSNSRLVISIAKKYIGRGLPFIDLIQEGNIGLMRAAKKFDYKLGLKFSTYATWWIRQAVTRAISNDRRTIRLPVQLGDQINKVKQMENILQQEYGREPTDAELAKSLDLTPSKIEALKNLGWQPISLEAPMFDDDESSFGDFIEDEDAPAPEESAFLNLARDHVQQALKTLPLKEYRILQMRYGLLDGKIYTLAEIGRELGVTRERVRQIESRALKRLRSPKMKHMLGRYID